MGILMQKLPTFLLCTFGLLANAGCGKGFNDEVAQEEEISLGEYIADLRPINSHLLKLSGKVRINANDNQFWVRINIEGFSAQIMHAQYLHTGTSCPNRGSDLNQDGVVDVREGHRFFDDMLIPIDSNLNSRVKGITDFPVMPARGHYFYSTAASIIKMTDDLKSPLFTELMYNLRPDEDFNLSGRAVVIYGVKPSTHLPTSVEGFDDFPLHETIPVACGVLLRKN